MIEDLLDVSRIASGHLPVRAEPLDVTRVVEAAVDAVRPAAANKAIDLRTTLADARMTVIGDAGRLQQAVWNLLVNAIKFTPRGGRVDVTVAAGADHVAITVRDSGIGIPRDALPIIFDRFRQADSRATRAHGGLGLGLTIVEHVAQAHGGVVRAESAGADQGATFQIVLPVREPVVPHSRSAPRAEGRPDLSGRRLLVVDDDQDALDLVRTVLESCGAAVITAASVSDAVESARRTNPELLIADIGMPEQDGYDLIRLLRSTPHGRQMPALALTAYTSQRHREAAVRAGYDAHLGKPLDPDVLCATVADLWRTRSQPT